VFKISGHVLGAIPAPRGNQMALAQVKLGSVTRRCAADQTEYGNPAMSITGGVTPDGVFEIREVPPGAYAVCVKSAGGPSGYGLVGYTTVDRDASGLTFKVAEAAPAGGPRGRGVIRP
jgi:hypothetical protein